MCLSPHDAREIDATRLYPGCDDLDKRRRRLCANEFNAFYGRCFPARNPGLRIILQRIRGQHSPGRNRACSTGDQPADNAVSEFKYLI